ncbi:hypothetical protein, partial [Kitasatospora nipponensis]|uniref:RICIN domain-containing protein n=1 Tax=Kitasatospora nipponensis TaxID=258049 RepID=UPI0031D69A50
MRKNRFGFALLATTSVLALAGAAQAAPYDPAQAAPAQAAPAQAAPAQAQAPPAQAAGSAASGPAGGKHVMEVDASQLPAATPNTAAQPDIVYKTTAFTNNHGGKCLDGDLNTIGNNGAKVQLWDCNGW